MYLVISQAQAMRSTPTCSQVTHFMRQILLLHSSVVPSRVSPTLSESSPAPAPVDTCGRARRGQHPPAPPRPEFPGRRHPHEPGTAAPARLLAHLRASEVPTGTLLHRVRPTPRP